MVDTTMRHSSRDMLGIVAELNYRRVADVYGRLMKREHRGLDAIPKREQILLGIARQVHHRYLRGDYRHNDPERDAIIELCQALVRRHAELEGHEEPQPVEFTRGALEAQLPLPPGVYEEAETKVATEW